MPGGRNHLGPTQNLTPGLGISDTPVLHFKSDLPWLLLSTAEAEPQVVSSFTQVQLTEFCFKPVMMANVDDSILRSNIDGQEWSVA